ncbi:decapping enzyme Dcp1 like protein [Teratosphaeria destructans]|uniref:Decapping enzyme Dcp1 like protein n=1 Tax=Teratosphaeria destructans TaxID=418781 RepID=A0A9W7SSN2_9PEZI|nr:decapping enzyme Dcp1 like protein [Teratosphaeria destructans]
MPPKRRTTRAQNLTHPQPTPHSDYDTDTAANLTDTAASTHLPPPPKRSNEELNFTVLRRYHPEIEHILSIAPFAVVYTFAPQGWEKAGIEGSLFVCQLRGGRYIVVVLNRKSLENFVVELSDADRIQVTEEYIIIQDLDKADEEGEGGVYGLWVYAEADGEGSGIKDTVAQMIQGCALRAQINRGDVEAEVEEYGSPEAEGEQVYGMDGPAEVEHQMEEEEFIQQHAGQSVDLLKLFGGSSKPAIGNSEGQAQQPRFTATADTDFFRSSRTPAAFPEQQTGPPVQGSATGAQQPKQNALLDLFKR